MVCVLYSLFLQSLPHDLLKLVNNLRPSECMSYMRILYKNIII